MFSLLEAKDDIAKAQRLLERTIRRDFKRTVTKNIGYPGGTEHAATVNTDNQHWFWSADFKSNTANPRRLNWFGIFEPRATLQITVEVNTSCDGRNDMLGGFFARDPETGVTYLMHSGRVGGGTKGVSKSAFLAWTNHRPVDVVDSGGDLREGVLVMPIEGVAATRPAVKYVDDIARFKQAVRDGALETKEFRRKRKAMEDFFKESRGRRRGNRSQVIDYVSRHGDVVDALYSWRNARSLPNAGRIVKSVLIDMGVEVDGELVEIFEVKTSTRRSDLYAAVGQLMIHGRCAGCRRAVVLPKGEPIAPDLRSALEQLGITLMMFSLNKETATVI